MYECTKLSESAKLSDMSETKRIETIEFNLLLDAITKQYGYDFRNYARATLMRRIKGLMKQTEINRISEIIPRILYNEEFFGSFLSAMSVTVTEMFRDPDFYKALNQKVIPILETYPYFKIWHAGCATGEEVYSLAIMLEESDLLRRATIYGTDINGQSLRIAKEGIYPMDKLKTYTANYNKAEGKASFSNYYHAHYNSAKFLEHLKKQLTFSFHNLVSDGIFGEMNIILCRNVLIYFDRKLQNRVLNLFYNSLSRRGLLCLGTKESINFSDVEDKFEVISSKQKILRKIN